MHNSAIRKLSIVVTLILCVTGCGLTDAQKEATGKFADAATKFGEASSDELVKMRDQNGVSGSTTRVNAVMNMKDSQARRWDD